MAGEGGRRNFVSVAVIVVGIIVDDEAETSAKVEVEGAVASTAVLELAPVMET